MAHVDDCDGDLGDTSSNAFQLDRIPFALVASLYAGIFLVRIVLQWTEEFEAVVEKRGVLAQPDTTLFFTSPATPQG